MLPPLTLPASEPSFVAHGWGRPLLDTAQEPGWQSLSAKERVEFFDDAVWRFELFVNGVQVALERSFYADPFHEGLIPEMPPGSLTMVKLHFIQFQAGEFIPGTTLILEGRWYGDMNDDDVSELYLLRTRTVVFQ